MQLRPGRALRVGVGRMNVQFSTFNLSELFDQFNLEADLDALPAEDRDIPDHLSVGVRGAGRRTRRPTTATRRPLVLDTGGADPKGARRELIVVASDPVEVTAADIPAGADERMKHGNKVIPHTLSSQQDAPECKMDHPRIRRSGARLPSVGSNEASTRAIRG